MSKIIIFVSSTARDLPEHRKEVMDACLQQEMFPKMMEHLPASDDEAISASLKMVDEADVYVGIYAHRYGYVPAGNEISVTEMEYNRAVENKIPRLIFVMDENHAVIAKDVDKGDSVIKLESFKSRIKTENIVKFFTSPSDLRAHVINSLSQLRGTKQIKLRKVDLIQDARRMERNKAYSEAIEVWEKIRLHDPDDAMVNQEIHRLQTSMLLARGIEEKIKQLTKMIKVLGIPFFKVVCEYLKQPALDPDDSKLLIIDDFLKKELSSVEFQDLWASLSCDAAKNNSDEPNYPAFADRLRRGEIVLFLGPEISNLYDSPDHDDIVNRLARQADYVEYSGSLATLSEYYQMQSDYGRSSLVSNLHAIIHAVGRQIPIFQKLANIEQPLVLVSASYDTFLEDAFQNAGKKYVLLSSVLNSSMDYEIGSILLQYSDGTPSQKFSPKEQLSGLDVIKNGYSLIYEIRGFLDSISDESINRGCHEGAFAMSERNYFDFARYVDKLIPEYLIRQFSGRGLFFLGFSPGQWDDRLIIDAILDKRHQHRQHEPAGSITSVKTNKFQKAYWESRGVRRYELELQDFLTKLEGNL